ncbi:XdhC family protein [Halalkalibacter kiskunsagensis]|uniref:XdhC family protein n=1 Tax=Halalkalibacter kiskunsagensis TaxID=1548599 RepID=A0ABV6KCS0_9BACI
MKELYKYLRMINKHPQSICALATVIEVEGSAYRHEGAKMLFMENYEQFGLISGGCLEEDLQIHAMNVIKEKKSKTLTYDLQSEDDLGWGQGAGCNGKIKVLVEPFYWQEKDHAGASLWHQVLAKFDQGDSIISVRGVGGELEGARLFFTTNGRKISCSPEFEEVLRDDVEQFYQDHRVFEYQFNVELKTHFIFELHESNDRLYIFGAGPDVEPIVRRAAEFDYCTIVIDPRDSRCNAFNFPQASLLVTEHPETFLNENSIKNNSYVLIMTHSFIRDQFIASYFINNPPKYLGILGPKRRTESLLHPNKIPEWIRSPVGIDIDAEGAEEISISIISELIKARNYKRAWNKKRKKNALLYRQEGGFFEK